MGTHHRSHLGLLLKHLEKKVVRLKPDQPDWWRRPCNGVSASVTDSKITLYADDIALYKIIRNPRDYTLL